MPELKLVEGWTAPIEETLTATVNNVATPVDLTGTLVTLLLQKADGSPVDTIANVVVHAPTEGKVRFSPDPLDLLAIETPNAAGEVWEVLSTGAIALGENALLTLAELKAGLGIKNTDQDLQLAELINAVSDAMDSLCGRRLKTHTYNDEYLFVRGDLLLDSGRAWLDVESPITALTALSIDGVAQTIWQPSSFGSPLDADVYVLEGRDPKHGRDRLGRTTGWTPGTLVCRTYTAGYGPVGFPVPGDLKQGVLSLAVDAYYRRSRQAEPVISRSAGAETVTYVNEALPRTFRPLLNAYRRWW
jgi:hypothetical protein